MNYNLTLMLLVAPQKRELQKCCSLFLYPLCPTRSLNKETIK